MDGADIRRSRGIRRMFGGFSLGCRGTPDRRLPDGITVTRRRGCDNSRESDSNCRSINQ